MLSLARLSSSFVVKLVIVLACDFSVMFSMYIEARISGTAVDRFMVGSMVARLINVSITIVSSSKTMCGWRVVLGWLTVISTIVLRGLVTLLVRLPS